MSVSTRSRLVVVLLLAGVGQGAVAGAVWEWWWTPPEGMAFAGQWYLTPPGPDVAFGGTALYVAVAVPFGIALGGAAALVGRDVLALMLTTMVASSVAAGVMFAVGHALGPSDPDAVSVDSADYAPVPSDLSFTTEKDDPAWASSALVAFPLGAMAGMTAILLVLRGPEEVSVRSARPEPR